VFRAHRSRFDLNVAQRALVWRHHRVCGPWFGFLRLPQPLVRRGTRSGNMAFRYALAGARRMAWSGDVRLTHGIPSGARGVGLREGFPTFASGPAKRASAPRRSRTRPFSVGNCW